MCGPRPPFVGVQLFIVFSDYREAVNTQSLIGLLLVTHPGRRSGVD